MKIIQDRVDHLKNNSLILYRSPNFIEHAGITRKYFNKHPDGCEFDQ
jgi:hypothetical protein